MLYKTILILIIVAIVGFVAKDLLTKYQNNFAEVVHLYDSDFEQTANSGKQEEVFLDDRDIEEKFTVNSSDVENQVARNRSDDGAEISTTTDVYGNTTQKKVFYNHTRVKMVIVKTASNGNQQVYVYGQTGKVRFLNKKLPFNALDASADQIADSAQIYDTVADVKRRKLDENQRKDRLRETERQRQIESQTQEQQIYNNSAENQSEIDSNNIETQDDSEFQNESEFEEM